MITQKFKNGQSEIRIESAESVDDAKINGFIEGQYTRYFIDDKPSFSYMAVISHIIDNTKNGNTFKAPTEKEIKELQKDIISRQKKMMLDQLSELKARYKSMNVPEEVLIQFDKMSESMDLCGVRISE